MDRQVQSNETNDKEPVVRREKDENKSLDGIRTQEVNADTNIVGPTRRKEVVRMKRRRSRMTTPLVDKKLHQRRKDSKTR